MEITDGIEGIYGIYDGNYVLGQIVVDKGDEEIDGIYEYKCSGSLGMIYLNLEKGKILKAQPCDIERGGQELAIHEKAGSLAPEIFSSSIQILKSREDVSLYNGDIVLIIIMEYLDPEEWIPLHSVRQFEVASSHILYLTYALTFDKKLINITDYTGYSGDHIYLNKRTMAMKVLDFGYYKHGNDPSNDFMMMCNEIQGAKYNKYPSPEDLHCYDLIMDLSSPVPDECQDYYLYRCRVWLFNKLGIDPIRNTRLRDKLTRKKTEEE